MSDSSVSFVPNAGNLLLNYADVGTRSLKGLRRQVTAPHLTKKLRTWGKLQAASMIGRSVPTLNSLCNRFPELAPPVDDRGRPVFSLPLVNAYREKAGTLQRRPPGSRAVVCAVTNFKGGAGKSTTSIHLAQKCALEGLRVLAIDLDPQATFTLHFGILPDMDLEPDQTIANALVVNPADVSAVILKTYFEGIDLIPSNLALQDAELQLLNPGQNNSDLLGLNPIQRLAAAIEHVEDDYDVVVLDCGPNLGVFTMNAVYAATGLLVPIPPAMPDFGSARHFFQSMGMFLSRPETAKSLDFLKVVISRHGGSSEAEKVEALIRLNFEASVMKSVVVDSVEVERASNRLSGIYEHVGKTSKAFQRAVESVDAVNNELIAVFREVWSKAQNQELNRE